MKLWIKKLRKQRIAEDHTVEFSGSVPETPTIWHSVLSEAVKPMDLACPIVMRRHCDDLTAFARTEFRPSDFMEPVDFDVLEVSILPEKKIDSIARS